MFVENGHSKQLLKNLLIKYNNKKNNKSNQENNTENRDSKNLKKLPWIPNISPKIKHKFKKIRKHCLHVVKKSTINSLSKEQTKTTTTARGISVRLLMQWKIYLQVKKEGTYTMHRTSTGQHEWKWGIMWATEHTKECHG